MTVRLTDEDRRLVKAAAAAEEVSASEWMARQIRRSARERQIAAYTGPDPDTQAWQALADDAATVMLQFSAEQAA